jgi:hypothetical protein
LLKLTTNGLSFSFPFTYTKSILWIMLVPG